MQLSHISLTNFRNFMRLEASFPPGVSLLTGPNGQGKTSILEAIYLLTGSASPHASHERQLVNFLMLRESAPFARLVAEVQSADRAHRIEIRLILERPENSADHRARKEVLLNGVKRRVRALSGVFNAVLFLPQDMRVLENAPSHRRRFMDEALAQADPTYGPDLNKYGKVLTQRNALLRQLQEGNGAPDQLDFWDQQLADHAASITRARALALHELETFASPIHKDLTRQQEVIRLEYLPGAYPTSPANGQLDLPMNRSINWAAIGHEQIRQSILEGLDGSHREELARGSTIIGPHRDDFRFISNGIDLRSYGSRGQNRTAMLSLKLAQVEWLRARTGHFPVLLLDEVLSELDVERRTDLLQRVGDAQQAILTSSDLGMFDEAFRREAPIWEVVNGAMTPREA